MTFRLAFYKAEGGLHNKVIRWWDCGKYSHVELVFSDGMSATATVRDGSQVRMKRINYDPAKWDFIELPASLEAQARHFYAQTKGMKYDLIGQLRFAVAPYKGVRSRYWCSEWVAAALGMADPWRYGPNGLYAAIKAHERLLGTA